MASSSNSLINLGKYVKFRLDADQNVSPSVVYSDFMSLYGKVHQTTAKTVGDILRKLKENNFKSLNQGPFFQSVSINDHQLPINSTAPLKEHSHPLTTLIEEVFSEEEEELTDESDEECVNVESSSVTASEIVLNLPSNIKRAFILQHFLLGRSLDDTVNFLQTHFGEVNYSRKLVSHWYSRFESKEYNCEDKSGRGSHKKIEDSSFTQIIEEQPRSTAGDIARFLNVSKSSVYSRMKLIGYKLKYEKWLPYELKDNQKEKRLEMCKELLAKFQNDSSLLDRIITMDETWVSYDSPKRIKLFVKKGSSPEGGAAKKDFRKRKIMLTVFWCTEGTVHYEFLPRGKTITSSYYCSLLDRVQMSIRMKFPHFLSGDKKLCFQHDNAPAHTATITKTKLKELGWEVLPHPAYSPDLAPSDFHLFLSLSNLLRGEKFENDDQMKDFIEKYFHEKSKDSNRFYREGIFKLPERWDKCIKAEGRYFE